VVWLKNINRVPFSDHPYEVTAEMIEPGDANFIPRDAC
jgi:hypothetical protein